MGEAYKEEKEKSLKIEYIKGYLDRMNEKQLLDFWNMVNASENDEKTFEDICLERAKAEDVSIEELQALNEMINENKDREIQRQIQLERAKVEAKEKEEKIENESERLELEINLKKNSILIASIAFVFCLVFFPTALYYKLGEGALLFVSILLGIVASVFGLSSIVKSIGELILKIK